MTDEQIAAWKVERDIARGISDENERSKALQKVYDHRDEMQMTCIAHQSRRQKEMIGDITELKAKLSSQEIVLRSCQESDKEFRTMKERGKGAIWGARLFIALAGVVGFETLKGIVSALQSICH